MAKLIVRGCLAALWLAIAGSTSARAGGGPENLFLVVNSASWASQTVANHFIALRHVPAGNVFYLDWTLGTDPVEGRAFYDKILMPVLNAVDNRGLTDQIDYVIYSSDFPYAVELSKYFANVKFGDLAYPTASLNSATYFWNVLAAHSPVMMDIHANLYMRLAAAPDKFLASRGFRAWYGWGPKGELIEAGGQPFLLSTMLAVTSGRGNSVREAVHYLERSASADGTHPKGTIYYAQTNDKRTTPRSPGFGRAVAELRKLGVRAEVIGEPLPADRRDVAGAMIGIADYSWAQSHSRILPGAICDNLTSFGGMMSETGGQTPLTEFLRYGAAGSCGTVVEPYNPAEKFPSPEIQVHYARGSSLAEAFYQSIYGPTQMLIVGDPLCQPWANIPVVKTTGVPAGNKVSGPLSLKPQATFSKPAKVNRYELFVDGRRLSMAAPDEELRWDSRGDGDGHHDLRVVAVEEGAIETQGRQIIPAMVDNHGRSVELVSKPAERVSWDEPLTVAVRSAGAAQIYVVHNNRVLGRVVGESGEVKINPRGLGLGPVTLQAIAVPAKPPQFYVRSAPLALSIEPPAPLPASTEPLARLKPGLTLKLSDGKLVEIQETRDPAWIELAGVGRNQPFAVQAFFDVPHEDVYQFQVSHYGDLQLVVDKTLLYSGVKGDFAQRFIAVALAKGRHRLTLSGKSSDPVRLKVLFGGPGAVSLQGKTFRHPAS